MRPSTHRFVIAKLNCVTHKQNEMKECVQTAVLIANHPKSQPRLREKAKKSYDCKAHSELEIIILSNYIRILDVSIYTILGAARPK